MSRYEYRWEREQSWSRAWGASEQEAADHLASLVGSTCPVPGRYRRGKRSARRLGDGRWGLPGGGVVLIRETEQ